MNWTSMIEPILQPWRFRATGPFKESEVNAMLHHPVSGLTIPVPVAAQIPPAPVVAQKWYDRRVHRVAPGDRSTFGFERGARRTSGILPTLKPNALRRARLKLTYRVGDHARLRECAR